MEFTTVNPCTSGGGYQRYDDGTTNNAIGFIGQPAPPLTIAPASFTGGVINFSPAGPSITAGAVHKAAISNVASGDAWSVDGVLQLASGTPPAPVPTGLNRLRIGNWGTGVARVLNGCIRRSAYWPRPMGNFEVGAITLPVPQQILVLTINWTATRPLIPGEMVRLAYRWNTSN